MKEMLPPEELDPEVEKKAIQLFLIQIEYPLLYKAAEDCILEVADEFREEIQFLPPDEAVSK